MGSEDGGNHDSRVRKLVTANLLMAIGDVLAIK